MKSALFYLLIGFYTCQADFSVEEYEIQQRKLNYNVPATQDLLNSEYPTIKKIETITHPLLDEIRLEGAIAREAGKDPSDCIHQVTKFLLSSVDDFFKSIDKCKINTASDLQITNAEEVSSCNEKVISAFGSVINGAREYFRYCIISTPNTSP